MATQLKAVPAVAPFALALLQLDALRTAVIDMVGSDLDVVDLRLVSNAVKDATTDDFTPAIGLTVTLKPFVDATKTALKLESGFLAGYGVMHVRTTLKSTSSSRRIVTALVVENADG